MRNLKINATYRSCNKKKSQSDYFHKSFSPRLFFSWNVFFLNYIPPSCHHVSGFDLVVLIALYVKHFELHSTYERWHMYKFIVVVLIIFTVLTRIGRVFLPLRIIWKVGSSYNRGRVSLADIFYLYFLGNFELHSIFFAAVTLNFPVIRRKLTNN